MDPLVAILEIGALRRKATVIGYANHVFFDPLIRVIRRVVSMMGAAKQFQFLCAELFHVPLCFEASNFFCSIPCQPLMLLKHDNVAIDVQIDNPLQTTNTLTIKLQDALPTDQSDVCETCWHALPHTAICGPRQHNNRNGGSAQFLNAQGAKYLVPLGGNHLAPRQGRPAFEVGPNIAASHP
jgi:hypothetical protein